MKTIVPLRDKLQTSKEMHRLIKKYSNDLNRVYVNINGSKRPLSVLTLGEYFNIIRKIPYQRDIAPIEIVKRPLFTLRDTKKGVGADCKKKAILISSFLLLNGIQYRLIGSSSRKDKRVHHVFPQALLGGKWVNVDATYPHFKIGESKKITKAEVI